MRHISFKSMKPSYKAAFVVAILAAALVPPLYSVLRPESPVHYQFADTSIDFPSEGISSFAAYQTEEGICIIGGDIDGMMVYRLGGDESYEILTVEDGVAPGIYDATEWTHYSDVYSNVLTVQNRTPVEVWGSTEDGGSPLFTIEGITHDDVVQIVSSPRTTLTYVSYRQYVYVYDNRSGHISAANLTALKYAQIESMDCSTNKLVVSTVNGIGVFDHASNTTAVHLISPEEAFAARPATACDEDCQTLYVGMKDGIHVFSYDNGSFAELDHITKHQGLPADSITSLWLDHAARRLYVGTEKGLVAYDTDNGIVNGRSLESAPVNAVYTKEDVVLAATDKGFYILQRGELEESPIDWLSQLPFWTQFWIPMWALAIAIVACFKEDQEKPPMEEKSPT